MVTGHRGYIGSLLVPILQKANIQVGGMDHFLFDRSGESQPKLLVEHRSDIRDAIESQFEGFDAVIHLAGISNDPLGDLNPQATMEINFKAAVHVAKLARAAGVRQFLFASSCSLYGAAKNADAPLTESAAFNPVTPYGESKVYAEKQIIKLQSKTFSPTFLRCATAYGFSPQLRADLVVNNLVAHAWLDGQVLLKSDGLSWRPLVHVQDICHAYLAILKSPLSVVAGQAYNVGRSGENYLIRDVAKLVEIGVPNCDIAYSDTASSDARCYQVCCQKLEQEVQYDCPGWTVETGINELLKAYARENWTANDLFGSRFMRIKKVKELIATGMLNEQLAWNVSSLPGAASA